MIADATRVSVFFGEGVMSDGALASDALMDALARRHVPAAALLRGIEGFGLHRRIQAERLPEISTDLPLLALAVAEQDDIAGVLDEVDCAVPRGLVTLETTCLATGADVARARPSPGPGDAVQVAISCGAAERAGREPVFRVAVELLRDAGAKCAVVLAGADGLVHGMRRRVRLFSTEGGPLHIVAVVPRTSAPEALHALAGALPRPVLTIEPIALLKHRGERVESLPRPPEGPGDDRGWLAVTLYARRTAVHHGRALFTELTRRLRRGGAAGATTIPADWGFTSDEHPHGDRLGRVADHRPTFTVWIDRPATVVDLWPVLDELTAEHGTVTCLPLPGYRERAANTVRGELRLGWS